MNKQDQEELERKLGETLISLSDSIMYTVSLGVEHDECEKALGALVELSAEFGHEEYIQNIFLFSYTRVYARYKKAEDPISKLRASNLEKFVAYLTSKTQKE